MFSTRTLRPTSYVSSNTNMRIWDLPVQILCDQHLLGEHRELHAIWTYLTTDKGGSYRKHPETLRWVSHLPALIERHNQEVIEIHRRGFEHHSPLQKAIDQMLLLNSVGEGRIIQPRSINTLTEQVQNIKAKGCKCNLKALKQIYVQRSRARETERSESTKVEQQQGTEEAQSKL